MTSEKQDYFKEDFAPVSSFAFKLVDRLLINLLPEEQPVTKLGPISITAP